MLRLGGHDREDILAFFDPVFRFVDDATAVGGNVLIHCVAGAHRAGTMACAFLMHREQGLSVSAASWPSSLQPLGMGRGRGFLCAV